MKRAAAVLGLIAALALGGCAPAATPASAPGSAAQTQAAPTPSAAERAQTPTDPAPPPVTWVPTPSVAPVVIPEVDRSCRVDADCAIKNVGNCCGYYPACVNKDARTFPDLVAQQCAAQDMAGVCGYPEIAACACVMGQCAATDAVTM